jgi:hypothetical protein
MTVSADLLSSVRDVTAGSLQLVQAVPLPSIMPPQ